MPRISIIMPVYNGEKYLRESIDSILNQTFTDYEFIIINDNSSDMTEQIILSYQDSRIRYYFNESNLGVATTLNKGIDLSTGKYIARMDADDISLLDRLEKQVRYMESNSDVAVLGGSVTVFGENVINYVRKFSSSSEEIKVDLFIANALPHPTVIMRKSVLDKELYRYDNYFDKIEDYELWCRIIQKYKIETLPDCLIYYRHHIDQVTKNYNENHIAKFKELKARQALQLGLSSENKGFTAYFNYCNHTFEYQRDSIVALLDFLLNGLEKNRELEIYSENHLFMTFQSIYSSIIASSSKLSEIIYLISKYNRKFKLRHKDKLIIFYKHLIKNRN